MRVVAPFSLLSFICIALYIYGLKEHLESERKDDLIMRQQAAMEVRLEELFKRQQAKLEVSDVKMEEQLTLLSSRLEYAIGRTDEISLRLSPRKQMHFVACKCKTLVMTQSAFDSKSSGKLSMRRRMPLDIQENSSGRSRKPTYAITKQEEDIIKGNVSSGVDAAVSASEGCAWTKYGGCVGRAALHLDLNATKTLASVKRHLSLPLPTNSLLPKLRLFLC